jgi:PKD repeat protein
MTVVVPPVISTNPASQTLIEGSNATFLVDAGGTPPLSYQWRFNGQTVPSATNSSFTRLHVQCSDAGDYDVVATNLAGSVTSLVAILTVSSPPVITLQPGNQTVVAGQPADFSVNATNDCGGDLAYQWQFSGTNLVGATNSAFTVTNAQPADAGSYAVLVTNSAGAITSAAAVLTILLPPVVEFTASPTNGVAPLTVYFTNLTTLATAFHWDFGDGNSSTNTNPVNTFTTPGSYTVQLTAVGPGGTNSLIHANAIVVSEPPPILFLGPQDQTNFIFFFTTVTGRTYEVQYKDSLDAPTWLLLQTVTGDGSPNFITNPVSTPEQRFYRLRLP